MPITRIVSGGQTGADRGGLDAALYCALPHGGWCPKGCRAEDGRIPDKYQLQEMPSADYLARTEANVVDSDATVIFSYGRLEGGSLRTAEFAEKHGKPWLHVDLKNSSRKQATKEVIDWLQGKHPTDDDVVPPDDCVLNVAGSRGSKAAGIDHAVMVLMIDVISAINGKLFYPLQDVG
jgi:hypothetical protein